jgi:pectate lyase
MQTVIMAFFACILAGSGLMMPEPAMSQSCPNFVIQGFGRSTTGGCGGKVIDVTTLANSGTGSLRACLEASGTRICAVKVSGWVTLNDHIEIENGNLTLDGSTAPNGGLGIKGEGVRIRASNVIFRHVRFRPGACSPNDSCEYDALSIDGLNLIQNIVLDHISTGWADDGALDFVGRVRNVTVQWSIIHDSLGENGCSIVGQPSDTSQITIHHSLFYQCKVRNPEVQTGQLDFRNNVLYRNRSFGSNPASFRDVTQIASKYAGTPTQANLIGNYYRAGSSENVDVRLAPISLSDNESTSTSMSGAGVYMEANQTDTSRGITNTQFERDGGFPAPKTSPYGFPAVTTTTAAQAYTEVLANAGATLPCRDSVDRAVISNIQNRGGASLARGGSLTWPTLTGSCGSTQQLAAPSNLQVVPQ